MSASAADGDLETMEPVCAVCSDAELAVTLKDGRRITTPPRWYPRLYNATPEQRAT